MKFKTEKKEKKEPRVYGRVWSDKDRRNDDRWEGDEDKDGVVLTLKRGLLTVAKGMGILVNAGHKGAFIKATFDPGTTFYPQDLVLLTVVREGHLSSFTAEAHVRFKLDETKRIVGKDGEVDLNLVFTKVDEDSQRTFTRWIGYGPNARKKTGLRRRVHKKK